MMRFLSLLLFVLSTLSIGHGFTSQAQTPFVRTSAVATPKSVCQVVHGSGSESCDKRTDPVQFLAAFALASVLSFGATPSIAHAADDFLPPTSSSLILTAEIKTLDMSLPSYGSVSDAKASVETVKGLAVEPTKSAPTSSSAGVGGGGPSKRTNAEAEERAMKKKEAAAAKQKAREAFEQENIKGKSVETVDFSIPSYEESTTKAQKSAFSL